MTFLFFFACLFSFPHFTAHARGHTLSPAAKTGHALFFDMWLPLTALTAISPSRCDF
jgi:hypothetical protein